MEKTEKTLSEQVESAIKAFREINEDESSRLKSWDYCYQAFCKENKNKDDENTIDFLSLHLAFYLASWGMYRGSSFLLQKSYKVHSAAVSEMRKSEYDVLRGIDPEKLENDANIQLLLTLEKNLHDIYVKERQKNPEMEKSLKVSDLLIQKIIMGVFGCVPAYDKFVTRRLKEYNIAKASLEKNKIKDDIKGLVSFYNEYKNLIDDAAKEASKDFEYPKMRVIDFILWQLGYSASCSDKENSKKTSE